MATERKNPTQDFAASIEPGAREGELVVVAAGEVDMLTAPMLDAELEAATGKHPETLVIDLSGVTFLDSSGCHSLVRARHRADGAQVALVLTGINSTCGRVLEIAGLGELFTIRQDSGGA